MEPHVSFRALYFPLYSAIVDFYPVNVIAVFSISGKYGRRETTHYSK